VLTPLFRKASGRSVGAKAELLEYRGGSDGRVCFHETTFRSASVGRSACGRRGRGESSERGPAHQSAGDGVNRPH
jgi:hypothetical protein